MRTALWDENLKQLRVIEKNIREIEAEAPADTSARGGILRALREKQRHLKQQVGADNQPRNERLMAFKARS